VITDPTIPVGVITDPTIPVGVITDPPHPCWGDYRSPPFRYKERCNVKS